jgi:hypothetical protein
MVHSIFINENILELESLQYNIDDNKSDDLSNIMSKHLSDKGFGLCDDFINNNKYPPNGVCHNYTYLYNILFNKYRNENIIIFEMGVGVPSCMGSWAGSLLGWKEYFPNTRIFSADIDKEYLYNDDRIKSYYADQENSVSIFNLWANMQEYMFDIIIDDGPHTYTSNYNFFVNSIHKLKIGGIFIIEDIHTTFIDVLYKNIIQYCNKINIKYNIIKLIIPWPKKFRHHSFHIMQMNNLIIIQLID